MGGGEKRYFVDLNADALAFYRQQTQQPVGDVAYGHPNGMIVAPPSMVPSSAIFLRSSSDSKDHKSFPDTPAEATDTLEDSTEHHHLLRYGEYETDAGDHVTVDTGHVLGQGRHSRVLGGRLRSSGQAVAIKQCHVDGESTECGRREGYILNRLRDHPGIPKLYGMINRPAEGDDLFRLALILQQASPLTPCAAASGRDDLPTADELAPGACSSSATRPTLPLATRVLAWAQDLFVALAGAHEAGIAHGDIKPHNLLLDTQGHLLVADWGTALVASGEERSSINAKEGGGEGPAPGTLSYTAPELLTPPSPSAPCPLAIAAAADVYSAGVTLYVLSTGRDPFAAISRSGVALVIAIRQGFFAAGHNPWPRHQHGLPPHDQSHLERVIEACVQADPHARPTARQVLQMLNDPNKASMQH